MPRPTQREGIDYETVWLRRGRGTGPALLFLALVLAVVPLSAALLIHGHANVQAVFQNAFG